MYKPLELSKTTESIVTKGNLKKYYRFRPTRFYGGIATADTVGCNLRCTFCWSGNSVWHAANTGQLYSPQQVVDKLHRIAKNKGYHQLRISGGEPTIGKHHLIEVLKKLDAGIMFILETNGILLGADKNYVEDLSHYKNVHVRVCLKGCTEQEFTWFTGATNGFEYQLKALENLSDQQVSFNIALVSVKGETDKLYARLSEMGLEKTMIEKEEIKLYPQVKKRLAKMGILQNFLLPY